MCFVCFPNKKFCQNQSLINHLKTHEKEKSFKCQECPKSFSTEKSLTQHVNLHNKAFWCNICNKQFKAKCSLKKHEET